MIEIGQVYDLRDENGLLIERSMVVGLSQSGMVAHMGTGRTVNTLILEGQRNGWRRIWVTK